MQLNLAHRKVATIDMSLESRADTLYVLQEPYFKPDGKAGVVDNSKFHCLEFDIKVDSWPRAAIYYPNLKHYTYLPAPHLTTRDICVGMLEVKNFRAYVASIYCDITLPVESQDLINLVRYCQDESFPLICCVDSVLSRSAQEIVPKIHYAR